MNIQDNTGKGPTLTTQQPSLPPLIKGPGSYKIIVPRKVEEKIRYLCRKFPTLEWSGVLFTSYEGSFEEGNLVITCQDLYPMDLGTSTYTEFRTDETVAGYIAENFDLFGCDMNLIHSHNNFSCFFSGTDQSTLRSEGNDQNCFVSLIVNNAGKYCAAITRKVKEKKTIVTKNFSSTYEFFGEGEKTAKILTGKPEETVIDNTYIEYFDLEVQVEQVDNPLAYLDARFDEIEAKKKKSVIINSPTINVSNGNKSPWIPTSKKESSTIFGNDFDNGFTFRDWQNTKRTASEEKVTLYAQEPTLFSEEEMDEMTVTTNWEPDPTVIHHLVCQMITCSLIVSDNIDLKQWITRWMNTKYKEIFVFDPKSTQFDEWKEFIVDFMMNQYLLLEHDIPNIDYDLLQSKVASAMYKDLYQYSSDGNNIYINDYMEVLTRYIYE